MQEFSNDSSSGEQLPHGQDPYTGKFKAVMDALKTNKQKGLALAWGWHEEQPGDLLALVALGEALESSGDPATAARAYGSIIDLFPARADLRRFAGVRLERLASGLALATDTFAKAVEQRADHPASHRLYAYSLVRAGKYEQAFAAIAKGIAQHYPAGRFAGVDQILREDAGLIAAAWIKAEPTRRGEIEGKLKAAGGVVENGPSLRFVLNWETDANDVDFHITDSRGGHAFYSQMHLPSGGDLYADVTTGYGPECFTIRAPKGKRAGPYTLQAHYYSIGPMGAGMGKLEIIEHDGHGGLTFEERPYVVMVNQAFIDLGVVKN
jgi:tetratricopeptide (TPR) repeat protein